MILDDRFLRHGAYVVPAGSVDWDALGPSYVPDLPVTDAPGAWHPEDGLFVPICHSDGHLLGIVSADEPASGKRPTDGEIDVLVALGDHAALAVQAAQETAEASRHRRALEALLSISSELSGAPAADAILERVCTEIRNA
ncbi:MAG TPA: GAF domain-containing protein, partial [Gaiellaceae bacterium]|nr:GAF domain-containing protein [Gaiellaceae bacterium]